MIILGLVCVLTVISFFPVVGEAQSIDFDVNPVSPPKQALPGSLTTTTFSVKNTGEVRDTYDLSVDLPQGWAILGALSSPQLEPSGETTLFLSFTIPPSETAGEYTVTLTARSGKDRTLTKTASTEVTVEQQTGLTVLTPTPQLNARPGKVVTYPITVTNEGNVIDEFTVAARSSNQWQVDVEPATLKLVPNGSKTTQLALSVPSGTELGTVDKLSVTVRSSLNEETSKQVQVQTTIIPPLPSDVPSSLYPSIPGTISGKVFVDEEGVSNNFSLSAEGPITPESDLSIEGEFGDLTNLEALSLMVSYEGASLSLESSGNDLSLSQLKMFYDRLEDGEADGFVVPTIDLSLSEGEQQAALGFRTTRLDGGFTLSRNVQGTETLERFNVDFAGRESLASWEGLLEGRYEHARLDGEGASTYEIEALLNSSFGSSSLTAFMAEEGFPAGPEDEARFSLSFMLSPANSVFSAGLSHRSSTSSLSTTLSSLRSIRTSFNVGLNLESLPRLDVTLNNSSTRGEFDGSREIDERSQSYLINLGGSLDVLNYNLSYFSRESADLVADRNFRESRINARFDLDLDPINIGNAITVSRVKNLDTGVLDRKNTSYEVEFLLPGERASHELNVGINKDYLNFNWALESEVEEIPTSFAINLKTGDEGFIASFEGNRSFSLPVPPVKSKGGIRGRVFIDENGDGNFDNGERGLNEQILNLGKDQAITNEEGEFAFTPKWPGEYELELKGLPIGLELAGPLPKVKVRAGETTPLLIPLKQFSILSGIVYDDKDGSGDRNGEPGLPGVEILVSGEEELRLKTDSSGRFRTRISVGDYEVSVVESALPDGYELTTSSPLSVVMESGKSATVNFGAREPPKPTLFTPTASFTFQPTNPSPGEVVKFDASASLDFDGEITSYGWSFGDGTGASGKTVEHSYEDPGTYTVTLTLIDNDEQKSKLSKEITVGSP